MERGRLFKNHGAANYSCRFTTLGRREHFNLGSANKKAAASKAAEIFNFVQSDGWELALARYKPKNEKLEQATVGDLIGEARKHSTARPQSIDAYVKAFRRIVSEIRGIKYSGKYNARAGGSAKWQGKVDAVSLATITPSDVRLWKNRRLLAAASDPLAKRRSIVTVNSLIRNAGALFGKKILPDIDKSLNLQRPLPLEGVIACGRPKGIRLPLVFY